MPPPRKKQRTDTDSGPQMAAMADSDAMPRGPTHMITRAAAAAARQAVQVAPPVAPTTPVEEPFCAHFTMPTINHVQRPRVIIPKGRLQSLPELAVEIQMMIYGQLEPRDLQSLSRTCRKFRGFFLNRALMEKLWKRAVENAEDCLPKQPPFLSEPAFIHLLYTPRCHYCGKKGIRTILPVYLIRLCAQCRKTGSVRSMFTVDNCIKHVLQHHKLETCNRTTCSVWAGVYRTRRKDGRKHSRFLKAAVVETLERLKALPKPITADAAQTFFQTIKDEYTIRMNEYDVYILEWLETQDSRSRNEFRHACRCRVDVVIKGLTEVGWGPEIKFIGKDNLNEIRALPVICQPSRLTTLTERSWRKVLVALDTWLKDTRSKRLATELNHALRRRFRALGEALQTHCVKLPRNATMDCRPQCIDLALMPECRAIIDVPTSNNINVKTFAKVVPALVEKWNENVKGELRELIRPHLGHISPDLEPLTLAIATVLHYAGEHVPAGWPTVLAHKCTDACPTPCVRSEDPESDDVDHQDAYTRAAKTRHWTWNKIPMGEPGYLELEGKTHRVPFNPSALASPAEFRTRVERMRNIVAAVGLNPAQATVEDMDHPDVPWLRCASCEAAKPRDAVYAISWQAAYQHVECDAEWRRADETDMVEVRAAQESWYSCRPLSKDGCWWACSLCPLLNIHGLSSIAIHLKYAHGIETPLQASRDGTIYPHPANTGHHMDHVFKSACIRKEME
ncbi:hypothetical protein C2E23DRAFT_732003 [Lenzites betulinus]|nr:hypothetical protein C2E23DRAFT_732003 [Lenzites betulinus]